MNRIRTTLALLAGLASLVEPAGAAASGVTNSGDDLRTGWYPDQPSLTPPLVSGGTFGQLWEAPVTGQVYAQPLLADGMLVVATEANHVYGLDPQSGAQRWDVPLGRPWNPADLGCGDLTPSIGVTATPVVDTATHTAYVTSKTYASGSSGPARWYLHAMDVATGAERPGFPVQLTGQAQNAPARTFDPTHHLQRPGLLLLDGVVYAAFGSHCDTPPWQGWIFGVSAAGEVKARWVAVASGDGAGIWQSGSGLMSDGPGRIIAGTGNPGAPPRPIPGSTPPGNLGESVVRLQVQPDGSLRAADFFAPFDAQDLDTWDADFASGGPVGLPDGYFGTPSVPHLAVAVGKQGYVYLLDRDHLGGIGMGANGADDVVQRVGPDGGVWSRPGVWPGDGGWVYIPTASGGDSAGGSAGFLNVYRYGRSGTGSPTLSLAATSEDGFGFSSSAPVITSDGTASGSALVWVVRSPGGDGRGAQLRAYDPVPAGGRPVLRWSAPVGTSAKFAMPGVGAGRVFVGTRDGRVLGFGSPVTPPLTAAALSFPATTVGESSERTLTVRANDPVTVSSIASGSGDYTVGTATPALPAALPAGGTLTVPVTFAPARSGPSGGAITVRTNKGDVQVAASGTGQAAGPELGVSTPALSFDGPGSGTVTLRNTGAQPVVFSAVTRPQPPFSTPDAPAAGDSIAPGDAISVAVSFDPVQDGSYTDALRLESDGGDAVLGLSGTYGTPGYLAMPASLDFGAVPAGTSAERRFTIENLGNSKVTLTKSKPPSGGAFAATAELAEGTVIAPHATVTRTVRYTPVRAGADTGTWQLTGNDTSGPHTIALRGTGVAPAPGPAPASAPVPVAIPGLPAARPGPVGWWSFSEGRGRLALDSSGYGNTGTISGARRTRRGRAGGALRFDGRGDRVTIPRALDLRRAMTFEAWVRPARAGRRCALLAQSRRFVLSAGATGGAAVRGQGGAARTRRALPARRWTHLAATWDGAVLRLYVDGVRRASRRLARPPARAPGPLRIGGDGRHGWFAGLLDEVRVYDRALDPTEIAADLRAALSARTGRR